MRIVLLTSHAKTLINFRIELIQSLLDKKHTVYTLAPDFDPPIKAVMTKIGATPIDISLSRTGFNPFIDLIDTFRLILLFKRLNPDLLFSYSTKPVIYGSIAGFFASVKKRISMIEGLGFVFTDSFTYGQSFKQIILKKLVSSLYKFALFKSHKVLFLNNDDLKEFVELEIVNKNKCVVFGGIGVDLDYWQAKSPSTERITFIQVSRVLREKGVYEFVEAAKKIKKSHQHVRFVIIGDIDINPGAIPKHEILLWVKQGLIEWPGYVNTKEWLETSSVFVLPSYREGVPRSTQEAMAVGLPIITTNVPGCKETVLDNLNGFLVPAKDSSALATAMLRFIEDPSLIRNMGNESRQIAITKFDVRMTTQKLVSIIESDI